MDHKHNHQPPQEPTPANGTTPAADRPGRQPQRPPLTAESRDTQAAFHTIFEDVRRGIAQAEETDSVINRQTARTIATVLANTRGPDAPHLRQLADHPERDAELASAAIREANAFFDNPELPDELSRWISWLAIWALHRHHQPDLHKPWPRHSDAHRAYLQLPDIWPDDPQLLAHFAQDYVGSFGSMTELLTGLTDITSWQSALGEFAATHGIQGLVRLDRDRIAVQVLDAYDVVALYGRLHAFDR